MLDLFIFAMSYSLSVLNKLKVLSGVDGTLTDIRQVFAFAWMYLVASFICALWLPIDQYGISIGAGISIAGDNFEDFIQIFKVTILMV